MNMLNPNQRTLYTDALIPPPGMSFHAGIATTFSVDPATLLSIPLRLAFSMSAGNKREGGQAPGDPVALLRSIHQVTEKLTVFCQKAQMRTPAQTNELYTLLEEVVFESEAPQGGAFHPKMWLLCFKTPEEDGGSSLLRLIIPTRNITPEPSWDLALTLEGRITSKPQPRNDPLKEFIRKLPGTTKKKLTDTRYKHHLELAEGLSTAEWELPEGFEDIAFHTLGFEKKSWQPADSKEMVVISPFLSAESLRYLAGTSKNPLAVISRVDQLAALGSDLPAEFNHYFGLHDAAEQKEDNEEMESPPPEAEAEHAGLHAKCYIMRKGARTHFFVGSANATHNGLHGNNVELLAELRGRTSRLGRPADIIDPENKNGLSDFLIEYDLESLPPPGDEKVKAAQEELQEARKHLINAGLSLDCTAAEGQQWDLKLTVPRECRLPGAPGIKIWPITRLRHHCLESANGRLQEEQLDLGLMPGSAITSLIGFRLTSQDQDISVSFTLNLPITNLPDDRQGMILRSVLKDRKRFLRYVRLLLADVNEMQSLLESDTVGRSNVEGTGPWQGFNTEHLLEDMVRAFNKNPERLRELGRVIQSLERENDNNNIIPSDFLELWQAFESALKTRGITSNDAS